MIRPFLRPVLSPLLRQAASPRRAASAIGGPLQPKRIDVDWRGVEPTAHAVGHIIMQACKNSRPELVIINVPFDAPKGMRRDLGALMREIGKSASAELGVQFGFQKKPSEGPRGFEYQAFIQPLG